MDGVFYLNIPGLAAYFDNSAIYFKTFCDNPASVPFRHMGEERESQAKFLVSKNATPILGLNLDLTGLMLKVLTAWPPTLH